MSETPGPTPYQRIGGEAIRGQWLSCMYRALDDCGVDSDMQALLGAALERMTATMVNRA